MSQIVCYLPKGPMREMVRRQTDRPGSMMRAPLSRGYECNLTSRSWDNSLFKKLLLASPSLPTPEFSASSHLMGLWRWGDGKDLSENLVP